MIQLTLIWFQFELGFLSISKLFVCIYRVSSLVHYYVPRDGPQSSYLDYIGQLPAQEHPELFGQHPNADIASQITEARTLFHTLLSLQPQVTSTEATSTGASREDKVCIKNILGLLF